MKTEREYFQPLASAFIRGKLQQSHERKTCPALFEKALEELSEEEQLALVELGHTYELPLHRFKKKMPTALPHSRGHARVGERLIRHMFWHEGVPFAIREYVARLVRFHSLPLQFLDQPNAVQAIFKASQSVRMEHLALLAEADVRGRICHDQPMLLEHVELFREFCRELECYEQPRQFKSPHSRFFYFQSEQRDPTYLAYDDTSFEVVLMSGLPGVGKDTWVRKHLGTLPMISLDEIRKELKVAPHQNQAKVIQLARLRARELLRR
jgi:AAA domain